MAADGLPDRVGIGAPGGPGRREDGVVREYAFRAAWALLDALATAALRLTRAAAGWHLRVQWAQARLIGWRHRRRRRGGVWY